MARDANDVLREGGPDAINEHLAKAKPYHANGTGKKHTTDEDTQDGQIYIHKWPTKDPAMYYGVIGRIARLATATSEADPVAVVVMALTRAAAEFGRGSCILIGDAVHAPRLFTAVVGRSALARKGTAQTSVNRIFDRAQELRAAAAISDLRDHGKPLPRLGALAVVGGPLSSAEGIIWAIRDPSDEKKEDGTPVDPGVEDKRMLVEEEEFSSVLEVTRRQGNLVSATLRKAYDGKTLRPLTKNQRIQATAPHINIIAHITLDEIRALVRACGREVHNGFLNRFIWPLARRQKILPNPQRMPNEGVDQIADDLASAIEWVHENPREIIMSDQAVEHWAVLYTELTLEHPGIVGAMLARLAANTQRIALVYALLDKSTTITKEHLEAAMAVARYSRDSVVYIFGEPEPNPVVDRILEALRGAPGNRLKLKDVHAILGNNGEPGELRRLLQGMQECGLVSLLEERIEGKKGRPPVYVVLNPDASA